jgi:hypothetical protein
LNRSTRFSLIVSSIVATAILLVLVGRWEERRSANIELGRMKAVLAQVGSISTAIPTGVRIGSPSCLAYPIPQNRLGLQLCFDAQGRLVESVDRSVSPPIYGSLAYDPSLSTIRFPVPLVENLLRRATAH